MAPRVGSKRGNKKAAAGGAAPRMAGPGDNQAKHAAEQAQLISLMSRIGEKQRVADTKKAELDAAREEVTEVYRHGKLLGYDRKELAALYGDTIAKNQGEVVEREIRRRHHRDLLGLPTGEAQIEIFRNENTPAEVRDEARFWAEGCAAFRRGEECTPPSDMAQRFQAKWMEGWHAGQAATAAAMAFQEEQDSHDAAEQQAKAAAKAPGDAAAEADRADEPRAKAFGYMVEESDDKRGGGFVCIDPDEQEFGKVYLTRGLAWEACNKDLSKQQADGKFLTPKGAAAAAPEEPKSFAEGDPEHGDTGDRYDESEGGDVI